MAGVCKKRTKGGLVRAWFYDWQGRQRFFTQRGNPSEVRHMAEALEAQHHKTRVGFAPVPKSSDTPRTFDAAAGEYLEWGNAQGGRNGHPWSVKQAEKREFHLGFWKREIGLVSLVDLAGCLPRVEKALRGLVCAPKTKGGAPYKPAGATLAKYAESLHAFASWCVQRGYMDDHPLAGLAGFDTTPKTKRRSLAAEDARALLTTIDHEGTTWARRRRMGYAVALCTGLRASELRNLRGRHLDVERGGLRLEARWTKNRRDGWQPLPRKLVDVLAGTGADDPLVFVAREASNALEADLERAGMKRWGPGGKADFHALRHSFVTMLHGAGADFEEIRLLARHAARGLTDGTYLHVRVDRLQELVESVGRMVLPEAQAGAAVAIRTGTDDAPITAETSEFHAPGMNGAERASVTVLHGHELGDKPTGLQIPAHHARKRNQRN